MPEQAFKGTVLEGRERRYTVINEKDVEKYLSTRLQVQLHEDLNFPLQQIQLGREMDGKKPFNSYIVINTDEPYIDEVIEIMKKNGHWEGKLENSREYFVVFEEHDPIIVKVNWNVNLPNNPDHDDLLHIWITENYGPVADYECWELSTCEKHEI